jgi:hypothetical protein
MAIAAAERPGAPDDALLKPREEGRGDGAGWPIEEVEVELRTIASTSASAFS